MNYYPISLRLDDKRVLVVGGGRVAERKIRSLLDSVRALTVVAPVVTSWIEDLAEKEKIILRRRCFEHDDLKDGDVVFSAVDDPLVSREIYGAAKKLGILINTADAPEFCDFILPAVVRRGDLTISVSTNGTCPGFAKIIKENLGQEFGDEYATLTTLLGEYRKKSRRKGKQGLR